MRYIIKIRSSFARTHNFLLTAADKLTLNNSQILMLNSTYLKDCSIIDIEEIDNLSCVIENKEVNSFYY
jgi:hypothetical protein